MTRYFADKRFLSETTLNHPPVVAQLLNHLAPYIEGCSLAGAGGGGFLATILKPGFDKEQVVATVKTAMAQEGGRHRRKDSGDNEDMDEHKVDGDSMWDWHATVDRQGLVVKVGTPCL